MGSVRSGIVELVFEGSLRGNTADLPAYQGAEAYQLAWSADGTNWNQIPPVAPVDGDVFDQLLGAPVNGRYLQLVLHQAAASPSNPVQISMLRAISYLEGESTVVDAPRLYGAFGLLCACSSF